MEKIITMLGEVLSALSELESPLLVTEIVLTAVMAHALRKNNTASNTPVQPAPAENIDSVEQPAVYDVKKETKKAKANVKEKLLQDVELLFSDKEEAEMTEAERNRCALLLEYLKGGQL